MARILILDGYNLIGARGRMRRDGEVLARERQGLLREISVYAGSRSFAEIHLVFDGYPNDRDLLLTPPPGIRLVFSEAAGSADAVIITLAARFRERAAVVSSDREVVLRSRSLGAETLSAQEFLGRMAARSAPAGGGRYEAGGEEDEDEDPSPSTFGKKKGNPRRLSKKERAQRRLLDKL
ncbi:MAG: NYN domain-containing protein [Leptospirillia bacterium]